MLEQEIDSLINMINNNFDIIGNKFQQVQQNNKNLDPNLIKTLSQISSYFESCLSKLNNFKNLLNNNITSDKLSSIQQQYQQINSRVQIIKKQWVDNSWEKLYLR